jgi:hypothetical protein
MVGWALVGGKVSMDVTRVAGFGSDTFFGFWCLEIWAVFMFGFLEIDHFCWWKRDKVVWCILRKGT